MAIPAGQSWKSGKVPEDCSRWSGKEGQALPVQKPVMISYVSGLSDHLRSIFFSKHRISGFQTPKQHLLHHKLVHPNDWVSWHNPSNIVYVRLRLSAKRILVNYTLWKPNNVVRSGFHSLVIPAGHCPFIQWWGCVHPGQGGTLMWTGSQGGYLWEKEMTICELRRGP